MPISQKYKCIFVHIPKCAGTSIEKALLMNGADKVYGVGEGVQLIDGALTSPQHLPPDRLRIHPLVEPFWDEFFKFTVIRHPIDRLLSEYWWQHRGSEHECSPDHFDAWFDEFYRVVDSDHKFSQARYLLHPEDDYDLVIRFEALNEGWEQLLDRLDVPFFPLPKVNSTEKPVQVVTPQMMMKLIRHFTIDFHVTGYSPCEWIPSEGLAQ